MKKLASNTTERWTQQPKTEKMEKSGLWTIIIIVYHARNST